MGRRLVSLVFYSMLLLDATLFFILAVTSVQALVPASTGITGSRVSMMLPSIMALLMIPLTNGFTDMEGLSHLSAIGTISTVALCILLISMYSISFNPNFHAENHIKSSTEIWKGTMALAKSFGVIR